MKHLRVQSHPCRNQHGSGAVEAAVSVMLFLFIAFGVIEYGALINERNALTQLAREGASLASRNLTTDQNMLDLLDSTDNALDFKKQPNKYRIFLAQIDAGEDAANPDARAYHMGLGDIVKQIGKWIDPIDSFVSDFDFELNAGAAQELRRTNTNHKKK